jgi:hypothetical protein
MDPSPPWNVSLNLMTRGVSSRGTLFLADDRGRVVVPLSLGSFNITHNEGSSGPLLWISAWESPVVVYGNVEQNRPSSCFFLILNEGSESIHSLAFVSNTGRSAEASLTMMISIGASYPISDSIFSDNSAAPLVGRPREYDAPALTLVNCDLNIQSYPPVYPGASRATSDCSIGSFVPTVHPNCGIQIALR